MSSEHRPVDEAFNLLTHWLGMILSIAATVVIMWTVVGESTSTVIACSVYGLTLILLYGASTPLHTFHDLE